MADWVKTVPYGVGGFPRPETLPPDGARVEYLRRHYTGGFPPDNIFEIRLRGEVRRVRVMGRESAEMRGAVYVLPEDETFTDEPEGTGDYWRLIE